LLRRCDRVARIHGDDGVMQCAATDGAGGGGFGCGDHAEPMGGESV
jgi:hypothetical protein